MHTHVLLSVTGKKNSRESLRIKKLPVNKTDNFFCKQNIHVNKVYNADYWLIDEIS